MPVERQYYVYMLASKTRRLYVGITSDLERRVWQHRTKAIEGRYTRKLWTGSMKKAAYPSG